MTFFYQNEIIFLPLAAGRSLSIFSLLGYTTLLHLILKRHLELSLFATVSGIVTLLYWFALAGYLYLATQGIFYLGLVLFVINLLLYRVKYRSLGKEFLSPGIVLFIGLSLLYWLRFQGITHGNDGDVLNHWGFATKEMLLTDDLLGVNSSAHHKDYPPGIHLFHYFVLRNTLISEGAMYFAHFLFLMAALIGLLKGISWKQPHWLLLIILTTLYLIHALGQGVVTLRVDYLVSVYFAMCLVFYFTSSLKKADLLLWVPILFVIPLIKYVGYFFGILATGWIICDLGINRLLTWKRTTFQFSLAIPFNKATLGGVVLGGLLCCASLLSHWSWEQRVENLGFSKNFRAPNVALSEIVNTLSASNPEKEKTLENFTNAIILPDSSSLSDKHKIFAKLKETVGIDLSQWPILGVTMEISILNRIVIACLIFVLAFLLQPNKAFRIRLSLIFFYLSFAFAAFIFALLVYYLFVFGSYEGVRVASVDRYVNTFLLAFTLVGFGLFFSIGGSMVGPKTPHVNQWLAFSFCGTLITLLYLLSPPASRGLLSRQPGFIDVRQKTQSQIEFIVSQISSAEKVYPVYQPLDQTNPLVAQKAIKYDLLPIHAHAPCSSLGKPNFPGDIWTCDWTIEKWVDYLKKNRYTYLYLAKVNPFFWKKYGELFGEETQMTDFLFKIHESGGEQVLFTPVR